MEMKINTKQLIYLFLDIIISFFAYYMATLLRFEFNIPDYYMELFKANALISAAIVPTIGIIIGCYRTLWLYMGFEAIFKQLIMSMLSSGLMLLLRYTILEMSSGSIALIYGINLFILTTAVRGISRLMRWLRIHLGKRRDDCNNVVIVGAGGAGALIIKRLVNSYDEPIFPVAIVDDDPNKLGMDLSGIKVAGKIDDIKEVCEKYGAKEIVIAIISVDSDMIKRIYDKCAETGLPVKIFQSVIDMENYFSGDKRALKNVSIEDLLFRDSVKSNLIEVKAFLKDKVVMVTGGAGSIGSELCRQALECGCERLIIFDFNENGLFEINEELKHSFDKDKYELCLGSVRDQTRLFDIIGGYRPDVVFHAAAHKHVPMMEINPFEAIKNNVMGTLNVITACINFKVERFILISTDKAVNPTNIMGASKRMAELLVQCMNGMGCELAAVRFGNVLGSVGSVIPTFKRQIEAGGPVTVTHKDMKRYFMTIPEAVSLVLNAGALAKGGEIFVLDMGKPIKIYDLAYDLIRLSGLEPNKDIEIKITGLRPGEKLFEELSLSSESIDKTVHNKIFAMHGLEYDIEKVEDCISKIIHLAVDERDEFALREAVFELVLEHPDA